MLNRQRDPNRLPDKDQKEESGDEPEFLIDAFGHENPQSQ
jgi:hypothetical protein